MTSENALVNDIASIAKTIMERYAAAVNQRDVAAFISLYAPNVRIFDAWDAWEYRGSEKWERPISAWLASHVSEKLTVTFDDVAVHGSATCVAVTAMVTYGRSSADGVRLGAIRNRLSWFLQVHDGLARIVHEHTSVPIDFRQKMPLAMDVPG